MKFLIVIFTFGLMISCSASNYVPFKLNQGLQISLPSNWMIMNKDHNTLIESISEAKLGKDYLPYEDINSKFSAGYIWKGVKPYSSAVNFNVRFYEDDWGLNQEEIKKFSFSDINEIDEAIKTGIETAARKTTFKILKWYGTEKKNIGGKYLLMTQYLRSGINKSRTSEDDFMVKLYRYLDKDKNFTITISYRHSLKSLVSPVCDYVIETTRVN